MTNREGKVGKVYDDGCWFHDSESNADFKNVMIMKGKTNRFINVKEALPKQDEEVIVLCDDLNVAPNYRIAFGHIVDTTLCQDYNGWNIPNVVYWFPMPKLPNK